MRKRHYSHAEVGSMLTDYGSEYENSDEAVKASYRRSEAILDVLCAILKHLKDREHGATETSEEFFEEHRRYLNWGSYERDVKLIADIRKEICRVSKFIPSQFWRSSSDLHCREDMIHYLARSYRDPPEYRMYGGGYSERLDELRSQLKRLKKCRSIDDVTVLEGVGKKTAEKIRNAVKQK